MKRYYAESEYDSYYAGYRWNVVDGDTGASLERSRDEEEAVTLAEGLNRWGRQALRMTDREIRSRLQR